MFQRKDNAMKSIKAIYNPPERHWVGDGFPVSSLFSYSTHGKELSPFLLFDFAGPYDFTPTKQKRGVGEHPHRGFETVTIIYEGEVAHRDSKGHAGMIGPGDVQWMTAASGVLHEEFHSEAFSHSGGTLLMAQIWVNLPAKDKMSPPHYQAITAKDIPVISLKNKAGKMRVIAGDYQGAVGPAKTFTPMYFLDLRLVKDGETELEFPEGWNTALVILKGGDITINNKESARQAQLVVFETTESRVSLKADDETIALILSGEPINEPIVGRGPFVMNTEEEIVAASRDFYNGKFGAMS